MRVSIAAHSLESGGRHHWEEARRAAAEARLPFAVAETSYANGRCGCCCGVGAAAAAREVIPPSAAPSTVKEVAASPATAITQV